MFDPCAFYDLIKSPPHQPSAMELDRPDRPWFLAASISPATNWIPKKKLKQLTPVSKHNATYMT
jgi:hypothetical protein